MQVRRNAKPWARWIPFFEAGLLVLALVTLGVARFSRLSPQEQKRVELEAGLEQLYYLELDFFQEQGRYFDPTDPSEGLEWKWLEQYQWKFEGSDQGFSLVVQADLDEDGEPGMWSLNQQSPQVRQLVPD